MLCIYCHTEMEFEESNSEIKNGLEITFQCEECGYWVSYLRIAKGKKKKNIKSWKDEIHPHHGGSLVDILSRTSYLSNTLSRKEITFSSIERDLRLKLFSDDEYVSRNETV